MPEQPSRESFSEDQKSTIPFDANIFSAVRALAEHIQDERRKEIILDSVEKSSIAALQFTKYTLQGLLGEKTKENNTEERGTSHQLAEDLNSVIVAAGVAGADIQWPFERIDSYKTSELSKEERERQKRKESVAYTQVAVRYGLGVLKQFLDERSRGVDVLEALKECHIPESESQDFLGEIVGRFDKLPPELQKNLFIGI